MRNLRGLILWLCFCIPAFGGGRILVIAPDHRDFSEAYDAIKANANDLTFQRIVWTDTLSVQTGVQILSGFHPDLIVLLDNKSIRLYKQMIAIAKPVKNIPVVALMALQIESVLSGMPSAVGISYEVPAVTTMSRLRILLNDSIQRVGVVYRGEMESFFTENRRLCKIEHIELIGSRVDESPIPVETLQRSLNVLSESGHLDALWILNDNSLLTPQLIRDGWIPFMKNHPLPGVVGVETLLQTRLNLGTLAVVPDPTGLGAQAANLIYEAMDHGWAWDHSRIEKPLSVLEIMNLTMAHRVARPRENVARLVDRVVE